MRSDQLAAPDANKNTYPADAVRVAYQHGFAEAMKPHHQRSYRTAGEVHELVMQAAEARDQYLRGKLWKYVSWKATWLWEKTIDGRCISTDSTTAFNIQAALDDMGSP